MLPRGSVREMKGKSLGFLPALPEDQPSFSMDTDKDSASVLILHGAHNVNYSLPPTHGVQVL